MTEQKKPDLGLLEEDDDFEEFPAEGNFCCDLHMLSDKVSFYLVMQFPCFCGVWLDAKIAML